jgi:hypothetical protein
MIIYLGSKKINGLACQSLQVSLWYALKKITTIFSSHWLKGKASHGEFKRYQNQIRKQISLDQAGPQSKDILLKVSWSLILCQEKCDS